MAMYSMKTRLEDGFKQLEEENKWIETDNINITIDNKDMKQKRKVLEMQNKTLGKQVLAAMSVGENLSKVNEALQGSDCANLNAEDLLNSIKTLEKLSKLEDFTTCLERGKSENTERKDSGTQPKPPNNCSIDIQLKQEDLRVKSQERSQTNDDTKIRSHQMAKHDSHQTADQMQSEDKTQAMQETKSHKLGNASSDIVGVKVKSKELSQGKTSNTKSDKAVSDGQKGHRKQSKHGCEVVLKPPSQELENTSVKNASKLSSVKSHGPNECSTTDESQTVDSIKKQNEELIKQKAMWDEELEEAVSKIADLEKDIAVYKQQMSRQIQHEDLTKQIAKSEQIATEKISENNMLKQKIDRMEARDMSVSKFFTHEIKDLVEREKLYKEQIISLQVKVNALKATTTGSTILNEYASKDDTQMNEQLSQLPDKSTGISGSQQNERRVPVKCNYYTSDFTPKKSKKTVSWSQQLTDISKDENDCSYRTESLNGLTKQQIPANIRNVSGRNTYRKADRRKPKK